MKTIKITISFSNENNEIYRNYDFDGSTDALVWGDRVINMLDTLTKSNDEF